ncbi:MAG: DNA topoisomerase I [Nanoarchaeota archaeon]
MTELVITEKPQAARKIADALADGKPVKKAHNGVPYYLVTHGKNDLIVCCAVGHLYGLEEKNKSGWTYPVFDIEWKPNADVAKGAAYTRKYLATIKMLAKEANAFTIATDYDVEGEVIGVNVIKYACKQKEAQRMKFSTLTKDDLIHSYEHKLDHFDEGLAIAGETRHFLDYYYGINLSRALTHAMKAAGRFKVLSSGRVQGPALKLIVDKEKEIQAFTSEPYWQIELHGKVTKGELIAMHEKDKFWKKDDASKIHEKCKGKTGEITKAEAKQFNQLAPHPFDLTTLQTEAYRAIRLRPKDALSIAQELYTSGYISYPRTSSQQLPPAIGYQKIITALQKQEAYSSGASLLLKKKTLMPNNGKKIDAAHPAIYPTGTIPELHGKQQKLYDLIVRRFLASFGDPATRETTSIVITVEDEHFLAQGTRTLVKGWHELYSHYVTFKEVEFPAVNVGDRIDVKKLLLLNKETQPPKRFTQASIIKELEKRNLGTKATRANIVDTLFNRGYVINEPMEATELGIHTIDTLAKYIPKIIDDALTRHFEEEMEDIQSRKKKSKDVLKEAQKVLIEILDVFKKKEKEIGQSLFTANKTAEQKASKIGPCKCGGTLVIKRGKFGYFIACDKYPECKVTFKLPSSGKVQASEKLCEQCHHPMIRIIKKRPQEICINPDCASKKASKESEAEMKKVENGDLTKDCPKCKEGKLVPRQSMYGHFYGCSSYPKCKFTEKVE